MKRKLIFAVLLLWWLGAVASAYGEPSLYVIDVAHSILDFEAKSFLVDALGTFKIFKGDIYFDRADVEKSRVSFVIDANSIDTRLERRDNHLRGADFLDVARYPQIIFVSKRLMKTGGNNFYLVGDFTLHGVTKEIKIPVQIVRVAENRARFKGAVSFKRTDFGITQNYIFNPIEDLVKLALDINIMQP